MSEHDNPLFATFARADLRVERGEGVWLVTEDGRRFLDFTGGIAVNSLGHAHPHLVAALSEQAARLWHVSNLFQIPGQERLAARLVEASFADKVFFTNSGAEALECAIKTARRYQYVSGHPERFRIVTFEGAFHGRTLATIAAGGQKKYLEGFGPKVEGFDQVAFGDIELVRAAVGPETAGILIEPIQGEGGVRSAAPEFLRQLRALCDEQGLMLIFDEVQTGVGRTGRFFAYENAGVEPDILASAKGIGGGFPLGACLATAEAAKGMTAGTHGTTFGGNPLGMAVGNAVLDVILADGFLDEVRHTALLFKQSLASLKDRFPDIVEEVRGEGLLIGLKPRVPNGQFVETLRRHQMLAAPAGDNVVRFLPPLVVSADEVREAMNRIEAACAELSAGSSESSAA
ncbi:aspartate aminotransferase family protein [Aureimonas phyllosphaerae]|uniref:Acetylornithine aminotransferase n=1 Tax=Aureimonas phyllosphaerae TaxID=1166078 RepID=A0A7W6FSG2_9HYPH|nr:aspartate aminotransferase family protein [Aureimonas phyllosphaerae]MBB3933963.1 acetylornithine/N-succinyldiaminopimelate aminotransferase [Aureimonas phyllosphaerae]MBB3958821.1 acetylornithine/N-succinyldiaminopimelate aminotransferase [Aureimonas phyllosphaerae]SFF19848.1 acetylornithine aminotransferase apoenzyme [Aureimonas phyllosphaerae]